MPEKSKQIMGIPLNGSLLRLIIFLLGIAFTAGLLVNTMQSSFSRVDGEVLKQRVLALEEQSKGIEAKFQKILDKLEQRTFVEKPRSQREDPKKVDPKKVGSTSK